MEEEVQVDVLIVLMARTTMEEAVAQVVAMDVVLLVVTILLHPHVQHVVMVAAVLVVTILQVPVLLARPNVRQFVRVSLHKHVQTAQLAVEQGVAMIVITHVLAYVEESAEHLVVVPVKVNVAEVVRWSA